MVIIQIEAQLDGQHYVESQSHRTQCWEDGYVTVPSEHENNVISCLGYGDLTVEDGKFIDFIPRPELIPTPEEDTTPTQLDRVEAQVTYTAMMTDTLLEV